MDAEAIKALRRQIGLTQKQLAEALEVEVALVRDWEKGERFATRALCERMEALRNNPPPKRAGVSASPMQLLADPGFFTLVRKLLVHSSLRAQVEKLAADLPDPLDEDDEEPARTRKRG